MPLPDHVARAVADMVDGASYVLGERLVGAYVVGSFALGCADERSDVDVVVVVDGRPDDDASAALQALHTRLTDAGGWPARLDVAYADRSDLRSPMTLGRRWPRAGRGSSALDLSTEGNSAHARWMLRERGLTLAGPAPTAVVSEVAPDQLRAEALGLARARAEELEDDPSAYDDPATRAAVVLTACRVAHTAAHAEVVGTVEAARWALEHLPPGHHGVVSAALAARTARSSDPDDAVTAAAARALVWDVVRLAGQAALEAREV